MEPKIISKENDYKVKIDQLLYQIDNENLSENTKKLLLIQLKAIKEEYAASKMVAEYAENGKLFS